MTRGVAHPPELRAEVVAAVIAGASMAQVAAQFNLDKSLVSRWVATDAPQLARARDPETIAEMLYDLVAEHIVTLRAQLQAAARPAWLEKQSASELADLMGSERDTLIRLLAGFRPVSRDDDPRVLDAPAAPDPT